MSPRFLQNLWFAAVEFNFYNFCSFNYFCATNITNIKSKDCYHSYLNRATRKGLTFSIFMRQTDYKVFKLLAPELFF